MKNNNIVLNENDEKYIIMLSLLPWLLTAAWIVFIQNESFIPCDCVIIHAVIVLWYSWKSWGERREGDVIFMCFVNTILAKGGPKTKNSWIFMLTIMLWCRCTGWCRLYINHTPNACRPLYTCITRWMRAWICSFHYFMRRWKKSVAENCCSFRKKILREGVKKQRIHGFSCSHFIMSSRDLLFLRSTSSRCFKNHGGPQNK